MKKMYRALRYHDRLVVSRFIYFFMTFGYGAFFLWSFFKNYDGYRNLGMPESIENFEGTGTVLDYVYIGFRQQHNQWLAEMADSYLNSMYRFCAFFLAGLPVLLFTLVSWSSVLFTDRQQGWNRVLKAAPVTPKDRTKSLFIAKWRTIGICTAISMAIGFLCSRLTIGADFAERVFFGSIITVLIVVTVTTVWDILGVALGALFPSARLNLTIGITCCLTMMTLAIPFFLFWESAAWMQYTSNYIFGPGWLILIAVFAGTQVLAWFVLKRACACKE